MKISKIYLYISVFLLPLMFYRCSEDANPLPSKAHPDSWSQQESENFHSVKVEAVGYSSCTSCHGQDFSGGESKASCYECHSYPHLTAWHDTQSHDFHGQFLREKRWDQKLCAECHTWHNDNTHSTDCYTCHSLYPHFAGWNDTESEQFHDKYYYASGGDSCKICHGTDYLGGRTQVPCNFCHTFPHAEDWYTAEESEGFHGVSIREHGWKMDGCKKCHGDDYKGGSSGKSCYTCHTGSEGPETCNECHGGARNPAPPVDLSGLAEKTSLGVGEHQSHLLKYRVCETCHTEFHAYDDPLHIDNTPNAEIIQSLEWDRTTATCNSPCHNPSYVHVWNNM